MLLDHEAGRRPAEAGGDADLAAPSSRSRPRSSRAPRCPSSSATPCIPGSRTSDWRSACRSASAPCRGRDNRRRRRAPRPRRRGRRRSRRGASQRSTAGSRRGRRRPAAPRRSRNAPDRRRGRRRRGDVLGLAQAAERHALSRYARFSGSDQSSRLMSVAIAPGMTELQRMPCGPRTIATDCISDARRLGRGVVGLHRAADQRRDRGDGDDRAACPCFTIWLAAAWA